MQRRQFLVLTGLGAAAVSLSSTPQGVRVAREAAAVARARELGRPLLVLVVPADEAERAEREAILNRFLLDTVEHLPSLAACELVCCRVRELGLELAAGGDEPVLVLVEAARGGDARTLTRADLEYEARAHWLARTGFELEATPPTHLGAAARRLVTRWIGRTRGELEHRADDVRATLDAAERARFELEAGELCRRHPDLALRGAALLLAPVAGDEQAARPVARLLGDLVRRRCLDAPIPGSRWSVEEVGDPCPACGMAVLSERSRRFLRFHAAEGGARGR